MQDWTSGYVADIGYTFGYYQELNPLRVKLAFLNAGLVCPEFGTACELGFGQGMSANIHAAASLCSWHGTDFNPEQASFAQELATASGANSHLFDESFAQFAQRDLPDFDYIGLHGIWSWISDENRQIIVEFVKKRLKVGGILYISYNTLPGWARFMPIRNLMVEHAKVMGVEGDGILGRVDGALEFTKKLLETTTRFDTNSLLKDKVAQINKLNKSYIAHEYFNHDWHPLTFNDVAKWLEPAKISFACSANYLDHITFLNLTAEQKAILDEITDVAFKESVRDFMVNQQFRRDYWVKGARKITELEQVEGIRKQRFVLVTNRLSVSLKINGTLGEAQLSEVVYKPLLDLMADHKIRSFEQIEIALKPSGIDFAKLTQAILLLTGTSTLTYAQDEQAIHHSRKHTDKLNNYIINKSRGSNELIYLASPVTGGGIAVGRFQQLFVLAIQKGMKKPVDWAAFVAGVLRTQGQRIVKEGKTLDTQDEMLAELESMANDFSNKLLPILKALQIA
jgi:SAM-dependent methyltransferase